MPQVFGNLPAIAQSWTHIEAIQSVEQHDLGIECDCGTARLSVTALTPTL
ncbi:hypothetical protein H6F43_01495, partial [Leptolyngbya sp. FACHB-36]|nr:hypothetical protein [Leptolyngbya sp. FACHB-36]